MHISIRQRLLQELSLLLQGIVAARCPLIPRQILPHIYSKPYISMEEEDSSALFPALPYWLPAESPQAPSEVVREARVGQERTSSDLSGLAVAKQRFLNFAESLGELRMTPIRRDVFEYAAAGFKNQRVREESFEYSFILRNTELRIEKMRKTRKIKKNWGEEDLKILVWTVSKYCQLRTIADPDKSLADPDWHFLASLIPGVTPESCRFKWLGLRKVTLAHHSWTAEESELLRGLVSQRTTPRHCSEIKDWKAISQELYHMHSDPAKCYRNAKQCREHWTCYLSPKLKKGPWTRHEDLKLFRFILKNRGSKRWSQIAKEFNGRTENALKNRFTLLIDKQRRMHRKSASQLELIQEFLDHTELAGLIGPDCQEVYEEEAEMKMEHEGREKTKDEYDSKSEESPKNEGVRVEKLVLKDFESFGFDFWKTMQPCVMETNGQFRKITRKDTTVEAEPIENPVLFHASEFAISNFYSQEFVRGYQQDDIIFDRL